MPRKETTKIPPSTVKRSSVSGDYIIVRTSDISTKEATDKRHALGCRVFSAKDNDWIKGTIWSDVVKARRSGQSTQSFSTSSGDLLLLTLDRK